MSFAAILDALQTLQNPFPGLRPFETSEAHLFFGRDQQIADLLTRLDQHRFVAVVGLSGCGKSSLVRAGLIPALRRGPISAARSKWRIVVMRPAGVPFASLANELEKEGLDASRLRESSYGLVEAAKQLAADESLLLVVDQFEELFRYKEQRSVTPEFEERRRDLLSESAEFAQLLLTASRHIPPVFIVLTMRSDYLGDCAAFRDFAERLNDTQYLVPLLTREQRQEMIEAPLGQVDIAPSLVQRILNDAGDEPDQLPVLQHALMRTWEEWRDADPDNARPINLSDYEKAGGVANALNKHANELMEGLDPAVVARVFKRLTIRGADSRERRDPATLAELEAVNSANTFEQRQQLCDLIDLFRSGSATFLMPRKEQVEKLGANDYVDITHESLIHHWDKLRKWLDEESESRSAFANILHDAQVWEKLSGGLLRDPELQISLNWWERERPTQEWAARYSHGPDSGDYDRVKRFLETSRCERDEEARRLRNRRRRNTVLLLGSASFIVLVAVALLLMTARIRNANHSRIARQLLAMASFQEAKSSANLGQSLLLTVQSAVDQPDEMSGYALERLLAMLPVRAAKFAAKEPILAVAFSPDGQRIAVGGWDKKIRIVNTGGREVGSAAPACVITALAFSADGKYLIEGGNDDKVRIFDSSTYKELWQGSVRGVVRSLAVSLDSNYLIEGGDGGASIFDGKTGKAVLLPISSGVQAVAFSPDNQTVVVGETAGMVRAFNVSGKLVWGPAYFKDAVRSVGFSADGALVAAASGDKTARVFNAASGRPLWYIDEERPINFAALSADGHLLATAGADRTARVFDLNPAATLNAEWVGDKKLGRRAPELSRLAHEAAVAAVAFSPDGSYVLTASEDNTARLFESSTGREVMRQGHEGGAIAVAFSSDGKHFVSGGGDGFTISGTQNPLEVAAVSEKEDEKIEQLAVTFDLRYLTALSSNGAIRVLDLASRQLIAGPTSPEPAGSYSTVAISNAPVIAIAGDSGLRTYDVSLGRWSMILDNSHKVQALDMSPDGAKLAAALTESNGDKILRIIDRKTSATTWRETLDQDVKAVAFSPKSDLLVTAGTAESVNVYRAGTGEHVWTLPHPFPKVCKERLYDPCSIGSIAISLDQKWLAVGSNDKTTHVYDLNRGREIGVYSHTAGIAAVSFSRDGQYLATATYDQTGHVFHTATGKVVTSMPLQENDFFPIGFAENDRYILRVSTAGKFRVLRLPWRTRDLVAEACARAQQTKIDAELWATVATGDPPQTCPN